MLIGIVIVVLLIVLTRCDSGSSSSGYTRSSGGSWAAAPVAATTSSEAATAAHPSFTYLADPLRNRKDIPMDLEWLKPRPLWARSCTPWWVVLLAVLLLIDKISPYDLWGEIVENKTVPLGMVVAAMCLGISIIVAAAIH